MPNTHLQLPEQDTMGRMVIPVNLANESDLALVAEGKLDKSEVRRERVDALVDTGAAMLCLPPAIIGKLGLRKVGEKRVQTANGAVNRSIYSALRFEVMGRGWALDVMENPPDTPPLLGYIPLEAVDLQVNPAKQTLEGNPEHGGEWIIDMF